MGLAGMQHELEIR